ncbi:hypothetical protein CDD80_6365 [Ophiocordyceps camponoti-rufipedis]|uniref:Uncharacterized protein n=1 Tax=Ophiocordyceps camponoti-rufipedis TaxID=2004952 RepID=A0A2C5ZG01_9HYPO|nr:hypothetical protein CDD80_6365 [Ophiocordyceps camponoti-rufipedis]
MTFLLRHYKDDSMISPEVIQSAARNKRSGIKILKKLVSEFEQSISKHLTAKTMEIAAANERCGFEMMQLFVEISGTSNTLITAKTLIAAVRNDNMANGLQLTKLMVKHHRHDLTLNHQVVQAAAENLFSGPQIVSILMDACLDVDDAAGRAEIADVFRTARREQISLLASEERGLWR